MLGLGQGVKRRNGYLVGGELEEGRNPFLEMPTG